MAVFINSLNIAEFRGIRDLKAQNLNHINIISGDNNSGKTSILEAVNLLKNPLSVYDLLTDPKFMRERAVIFPFSLSTWFDCFLNMLSGDELGFKVGASTAEGDIDLELSGKTETVIIDKNSPLYNMSGVYTRSAKSEQIETIMFSGVYKCTINSDFKSFPIEITPYMPATNLPRNNKKFLNITYLSPSRHLQGNNFSNIVRSGSYKDLCVFLLQMFDSDIEDLLYIKNDFTNRPVEAVRHKKLGVMPLSTYGDGIKKVISLANGVASAKDGILMIDEIETSIHSRYYNDVFSFLLKACLQYNIQLFITTHSKEAIDALLYTQNYTGENAADDPISVITFRQDKEHSKTLSRTLSGSETLKNREKFDFEVRI